MCSSDLPKTPKPREIDCLGVFAREARIIINSLKASKCRTSTVSDNCSTTVAWRLFARKNHVWPVTGRMAFESLSKRDRDFIRLFRFKPTTDVFNCVAGASKFDWLTHFRFRSQPVHLLRLHGSERSARVLQLGRCLRHGEVRRWYLQRRCSETRTRVQVPGPHYYGWYPWYLRPDRRSHHLRKE